MFKRTNTKADFPSKSKAYNPDYEKYETEEEKVMSCSVYQYATTRRVTSYTDVRHPDKDSDAFVDFQTSSGLVTLLFENPH